MDVDLILKVAGEQEKTTKCCFLRSECVETRSNGSEVYLTSSATMFQEERMYGKYGC